MADIIDADADLVRRLSGIGLWLRTTLYLASRIEWGNLIVGLPDGRRLRFRGREPGIEAEIAFHDAKGARRLLTRGNVGFGEAFMDGLWSSPDVSALVELACRARALEATLRAQGIFRIGQRIAHALRRNSKPQAKRNIARHYDLGNRFYEFWLDRTMTYSSARFAEPDQPLEGAQANKYRALAKAIGLEPGHSVLEIGCGWGGFAEFAAVECGAKVTSITISPAQAEYARRRIFEKGLGGKVEIRLQDYRDLEGSFDRIASIEMFEAVGEAYWPVFFRKLAGTLKPGGVAGLQIITISDAGFASYRRSVDFIQRYIFPGGMLPSLKILKEEVRAAGLTYLGEQRFGQDYAHTLKIWRARFLEAWPEIRKLGFDERFRRMWEYYLSYCEGGFRAQTIDVLQAKVTRS